jgi:Flp pilus assembly protein TadD
MGQAVDPSRPVASRAPVDEAQERSLTKHEPTFSDAVRCYQVGGLQQAEAICRRILDGQPQHGDALDLLGVVSHRKGESGAALACFARAITVNARNPMYRNHKGVVHKDRGELVEATTCFREALQLDPKYAEAHNNLGAALEGQGKMIEALAHYREAVRLKPDFVEAHNNLGFALQDRGEIAEGLAHYREALRLRPTFAEAHNNLGLLLQEQGHLEEAMASFARAVASEPERAQVHWNRALLWLLRGDFTRGWPEYEWRLKHPKLASCQYPQPLWDGSPLNGRTILLHVEQGFGDALQFVRYAALVQQRGGRVVVACQAPLVRLLETCAGIDLLTAEGSPLPHVDVRAPLLSLPGIFRTDLDSIPAVIPYLRPPQEGSPALEAALARRPGTLKVGIVWAGSPEHKNDRNRSCPLKHFRSLVQAGGVALFSLQKGPCATDLQDEKDHLPVTDLTECLGDFADTAAAIARLDLVISVDTAVAHLAGALGKPVWVLLPFAPDWRWMLDREDSPWYPTARLFRQTRPGDWPGVFDRVGTALEDTPASPDFLAGSSPAACHREASFRRRHLPAY